VQDLPLEIAQFDRVRIDQADGPDSGCSKIEPDRRSQSAGPHHEDLGVEQLTLPLAAYFAQYDMAAVPLYLLIVKG
jgi:hypothetical protein